MSKRGGRWFGAVALALVAAGLLVGKVIWARADM
jgi:hypothetical protein